MIEIHGNLWQLPATWRGITTNGFVRKNGTAVMGRGCAREAATRFPGFANIVVRFTAGSSSGLKVGLLKPFTDREF